MKFTEALKPDLYQPGVKIMNKASDGKLLNHSVIRDPYDEYAILQDTYGDMPFPLNQTVETETTTTQDPVYGPPTGGVGRTL